MSKSLENITYVFGAKFLTIFFGVATQSCLAWFLTMEGRGQYATCLIFSTLLSMFCMIGTDMAGVYFVSSKKFSLSEGIAYSGVLGVSGTIVAICLGWIFIHIPSAFISGVPMFSFYLALAMILPMLFCVTFVSLLTAMQEFKWYSVFVLGQSIIQLLLTLLFVWWLRLGVNGALYAMMLSSTLICISVLVLFKLKYDLSFPSLRWEKLKEMLHYGLRYYIGKISNSVNFKISTVILAFMIGKAELALYSVASQLVVKILMIPDVLRTVLIPKASVDANGKRELVSNCARLMVILCGMIFLFIAVFAEPIVLVLFSSKYLEAIPLIRILCLGTFVRCVCKTLEPYFLGIDRPGIASISVLASTIVNILFLYFFLPRLGIIAAALGATLSYFISSAILLFSFSFYSKQKIFDIFRYRKTDFSFLDKIKTKIIKSILSIRSKFC